jgi:hypothetical protein
MCEVGMAGLEGQQMAMQREKLGNLLELQDYFQFSFGGVGWSGHDRKNEEMVTVS